MSTSIAQKLHFPPGACWWVARGCPQSVGDCSVLSSQPIKDVVNITLRDISCQAEKNATHFMLKSPLSHCGTSLEGRGYANNEVRAGLAGAVASSPTDGESFSDRQWGFSTRTSMLLHGWKHLQPRAEMEGEGVGGTAPSHPENKAQQWGSPV